MQFIRAPDENVYIAPFNLVEIVISGLFEWWMPKKSYEFLNDCVMGVLYSPLLFITAFFEIRTAYSIRRNRARGEADDDVVEEWEQLADEVDFGAEGWAKKCEAVKPNMEDDPAVVEVKKLRSELAGLKSMLAEISEHVQFPMTSQDTKIGDGSAFGDFKPFSDTTHEGTDHTLGTGKDVAYEQAGTSDSAQADQHSLIDLTDPFVDSTKSDEHSAQPVKDSAKPIEDAGEENKDSEETTKASEDPAKGTDEPEPVKSSDEPTKPVEELLRPAEAASESGNATTKAPEDTLQAPEDEPSKGSEDVAFESSEPVPSKAPEDVLPEIPEDMASKAPEGASLKAPEYVPFMATEDLPSETPEGISSEALEGAPLDTPEPSSSKAPAQDVTPEHAERVESEEAEEASPESAAAGEARAEGEQSPAPTKAKRRRRKKNKQSQGGPSGGS
jgi:hypothetical protein